MAKEEGTPPRKDRFTWGPGELIIRRAPDKQVPEDQQVPEEKKSVPRVD